MTRRCSHCGNNGHNSRTCPNRVVRLFGVRLTDGSIRKSASMGNLSHVAGPGDPPEPNVDGYASDDCLPGTHSRERKKASPGNGPETGGSANGCSLEDCAQGSRERKKGVPWTEEEHKMFLLGLKQLGKGDWRGIARGFVITRTPTQVASHAQKYFIRQTNGNRRKRRASLFDMPDESGDAPPLPLPDQEQETQSKNPPPAPLAPDAESTSMPPNLNEEVAAIPRPEMLQCPYPMMYPAYMPPPFYPYAYPVPVWPVLGAATTEQAHEIVRPTAVHSRAPANVEEINVMSALSLQEPTGQRSPALPPRYLGVSERHSAFHANPPASSPRSSPIHAV